MADLLAGYYGVLGLPKNCYRADIKKAFRSFSLRWHPKKNPDEPSANRTFTEICEAYEVLVDEDRRSSYDRYGTKAFEWDNFKWRPSSPHSVFEKFFSDHGGSDIVAGYLSEPLSAGARPANWDALIDRIEAAQNLKKMFGGQNDVRVDPWKGTTEVDRPVPQDFGDNNFDASSNKAKMLSRWKSEQGPKAAPSERPSVHQLAASFKAEIGSQAMVESPSAKNAFFSDWRGKQGQQKNGFNSSMSASSVASPTASSSVSHHSSSFLPTTPSRGVDKDLFDVSSNSLGLSESITKKYPTVGPRSPGNYGSSGSSYSSGGTYSGLGATPLTSSYSPVTGIGGGNAKDSLMSEWRHKSERLPSATPNRPSGHALHEVNENFKASLSAYLNTPTASNARSLYDLTKQSGGSGLSSGGSSATNSRPGSAGFTSSYSGATQLPALERSSGLE